MIDLLIQPITDWPHITPKFVEEWIPFISASAINNWRINFSDAQWYITKEFDAECSKKYKPKCNDVFMVKSWSTTWKVWFVEDDTDFNIWSPLAAMRTKSRTSARFLFHLLQTTYIQNQVIQKMSQWSQPNLSMRVLEQFDVPIFTDDQQKAIVYILDNFDKLANDLSEWLPAEITLRQQQYEYYRDKLLDFSNIWERERESHKNYWQGS